MKTGLSIIERIRDWFNRSLKDDKECLEKFSRLDKEIDDELRKIDRGDSPNNSSKVPNKPKPSNGSGAITLPLPKPENFKNTD